MPAIPNGPDDLTPEWFSRAIGGEAQCAVVTTAPLGVGVGLVGQLHTCTLAWDGPGAEDLPTRVVAKLAAAGAESRFVATVLNMYAREVGFYRELAAATPIPSPRCFFAQHDPETQDTVLILEDVSARGAQLDQIEGCGLDDAEPALRTLARMHAAWWEHPHLAATPWLLRLRDDPYPGAVQMAYDGGWPVVKEHLADLLSPEVRTMGDAYSAHIPEAFERLSDGPLTLAHADWRLDNLFFTGVDSAPVIAVDWQLVDRSVGPRDVAYLVTQSCNLSTTAEYTGALDVYLDELAAAGTAVDRDWALDMYRHAARFGWVYPVVAGGSLTVEDERHQRLCRVLAERCIAAMDALDAFHLPW